MNNILLSVTVLFFISGCTNQPVVNPNRVVGFNSDIRPILAGNCAASGCHGSSALGINEFPLVTYEEVINNGGINVQKPERSKLYKAITRNDEQQMPPNGKMTDAQIEIIYNWINQGAENN